MSNLYKQNPKKEVRIKYIPSKKGKISLLLAIMSLFTSILLLILNILSLLPGYCIIFSIISTIISITACIFFLIDKLQFDKKYNLEAVHDNGSNGIIYLLFGIIIALIFGRLIF